MSHYSISLREGANPFARQTLKRPTYLEALEAVVDHARATGGQLGQVELNYWVLAPEGAPEDGSRDQQLKITKIGTD